MSDSAAPKSSKKGRKIGRNKAFCAAYRTHNTALTRKARRILSHLKRYGWDAVACKALARCGKFDMAAIEHDVKRHRPDKLITYNAKRERKFRRAMLKAVDHAIA